MWLLLAFLSATLLGCYDTAKKKALRDNSVVMVLFMNTLFSSIIFLPFILLSSFTDILNDTIFYVSTEGWEAHKYVILKSCIVLSSWLAGYFAMKHLPLTIVGPINATRPVMVLIAAMIVFGERLNAYQWIGVGFAIVSFYLLKLSGKKEGINFKYNIWIWAAIVASILGAISGLYDKYILAPEENGGVGLNRMLVQAWFNIYQCAIMGTIALIMSKGKGITSTSKAMPSMKFQWRWAIILVSIFLSIADFAYFYALSLPGAMISVVSMIRRGSVIVSFLCGAWLFHERNLKAKALDLLLVLIGMIFLFFGSNS
ncbi:MAG: DMT family transporter [Bacteroidaceae bacterium]|nr:DMT family transporter [Bacteroidaceae bacterium]